MAAPDSACQHPSIPSVNTVCHHRAVPEPSDQRLYFLLQRSAHQLRRIADRRLQAAARVTAPQLGALFAVGDRPGTTQQELARVLGLRESAVTALVARLTAAGLLARTPHASEHRAVTLTLTDDGAAALRAARPAIDAFNAEVRAILGDHAYGETAGALRKLMLWEG